MSPFVRTAIGASWKSPEALFFKNENATENRSVGGSTPSPGTTLSLSCNEKFRAPDVIRGRFVLSFIFRSDVFQNLSGGAGQKAGARQTLIAGKGIDPDEDVFG